MRTFLVQKLASASRVHQLGFATRNVDARFTSSQLSNQSSGRIVKTVDRRTDLKNRPPAFPRGEDGGFRRSFSIVPGFRVALKSSCVYSWQLFT
ncbi:hypothetical protein TNIN_318921 [Trichonephila inaurata madagascariensis]|uniref:Uncharacterized protein n=1 Tax=Trichonephila inaurata madagascariensis TaxID=2747483 RepID=A0A8X6YYX3_9ARAC|nr:hypothetical protein TNIN_318921 [Trichonephila inaurata madagascariensis]